MAKRPFTLERTDNGDVSHVHALGRQVLAEPTGLLKHVALSALHDRNEVLFFKTVSKHMQETFPIIGQTHHARGHIHPARQFH